MGLADVDCIRLRRRILLLASLVSSHMFGEFVFGLKDVKTSRAAERGSLVAPVDVFSD